MTVRAVLNSKGHDVAMIAPDATASEAVRMLAQMRIGALLVMSRQEIHGILSERDIVRELAARGADMLDDPVSTVMTRKVVHCSSNDTIASIMEVMTTGKFRHLPVIDAGRLSGLISIGDVVKWRVREFEKEQEAMRDYIATA